MAREGLQIQSTGAIGDAVIALGVRQGLIDQGYNVRLISAPHTLPLWPETEATDQDQILDIRNYLAQFPHTTKYTPDRYGHLCEWMARLCSLQLGLEIQASRDNVRIPLSRDEINHGREIIRSDKPVVVLAPVSNTKNRNIPVATVLEIARGLDNAATTCLLAPIPDQYADLGLTVVGSKDLRIAAAALLAVDAIVTVDSGPLHLAAAAIQGNLDAKGANPEKLVVVLGSSHPNVVSYEGNQIVQGGQEVCQIAPCGIHGYYPNSEYSQELGYPVFSTGLEKDKSGCIMPNYGQVETASCMMTIDPNEITQKVLEHLARQKN